MIDQLTIFDFTPDTNIRQWKVVDDVVMGGRSSGEITISSEGTGLFRGKVSLENNGGFSSVRHSFPTTDVSKYSKFVLRLKGDGKRYQFRVKENQSDYYSFISYIQTSTDWAEYEIEFQQMYPVFRGRNLDMPNFAGKKMEELGLLIANKKPESFALEIDRIEVR
ncbi:MAG: CIA30 family protein [Bacteroidota bacterium]